MANSSRNQPRSKLSPKQKPSSQSRGRRFAAAGIAVILIVLSLGSLAPASAQSSVIKINEVESSGGSPGDWAELYNPSSTAVDIGGYYFKDNDNARTFRIPVGTSISAGGYYLVEEAAFAFGLGSSDAARLYDASAVLIDSYVWGSHATTSYGRCPNGTGAFATTVASTKGAANSCTASVASMKINEIESDSGTPGDWVELYNSTPSSLDISGLKFRDNDDSRSYTIPAGTLVTAGGYFVLDEAAIGFSLDSLDSARLFDTAGALIDSYSWIAHSSTTFGRCPNGNGAFTDTTGATKGDINACPGDVVTLPWPGDSSIQVIDGLSVFGGNMSGLAYEGSGTPSTGVLWAARNGPGMLFKIIFNGSIWTPILLTAGDQERPYVTQTERATQMQRVSPLPAQPQLMESMYRLNAIMMPTR